MSEEELSHEEMLLNSQLGQYWNLIASSAEALAAVCRRRKVKINGWQALLIATIASNLRTGAPRSSILTPK